MFKEKDIGEMVGGKVKDLLADCYEHGATAIVLVGFNNEENEGEVIRAVTGDIAQMMMLVGACLANLNINQGVPQSELIDMVREATSDCVKLFRERGDK